MRTPSARVTINRVDIYVSSPGRDTDAGVQFTYPDLPTYPQEPCTIQGRSAEDDTSQRISQYTQFRILFSRYLGLSPRDMIRFIDGGSTLRTIFVQSIEDLAGRGSVYGVNAGEIV